MAGSTQATVITTTYVVSIEGKTGVVTLADLGLDLVDNTSDMGKPISTAVGAALDNKQDKLVSGVTLATINGQSLLNPNNMNLTIAAAVDLGTEVTNLQTITRVAGSELFVVVDPTFGSAYSTSYDNLVASLSSSLGTGVIRYPFTATEGQTQFTLPVPVTSGAEVFLNGVLQSITYTYTVSGNTVTFLEGLPLNSTVAVVNGAVLYGA